MMMRKRHGMDQPWKREGVMDGIGEGILGWPAVIKQSKVEEAKEAKGYDRDRSTRPRI
jgi:hypothetical protein